MIGGNISARFERPQVTLNALKEPVQTWEALVTIRGFLDLQNGDKGYATYNAPIAESTHIFLCDYKPALYSARRENLRAVIDGDVYDVKWIDDPMGLHQHMEIYLEMTGGQANG